MASIQKGQTYNDLGFRVDNKGVAYDLKTGNTLSRQAVDALLKGTDMTNIAAKRGGLNGVYDRNKAYINPIAEVGLGLINPALAAGYGAAVGANSLKNPNLKGALMGAASGYGMGQLGGGLKAGVQAGMGAGKGLIGDTVTGAKEGLRVALGGKPTQAGAAPQTGTLAGAGATPSPLAQGGGVTMPKLGNLASSLPNAVGNASAPASSGGWGVLDTLGKVGDWAEQHPTAVKTLAGGLQSAFPSAYEKANTDLIRSRTNEVNLDNQRTAANQDAQKKLREQLEAMMKGTAYSPNVAQSAYPFTGR